MTDKLPKVSFVICTLNCKEYLERCLKSIRKQDYPRNKVEIVVVDSYSSDGTIETAKKYGSRIILTKIRGYMEGKGMPKSIGVENARGEIVITIDSDNALVENDWIRKIVYPLMNDKDVNFSICRMLVAKEDKLINRYLSLIGTDPFAAYCSIDPQISLGNLRLVNKGKYWTYNITADNFFICGGYYLTFKKETLKKIGGYSRDVDTIYNLAKRKTANVAIPKNAHLHHLIASSSFSFLKKKVKWGKHYFTQGNQGRELEWSKGIWGKFGKIRFVYQVLLGLSVIPALAVSIKMLAKTHEKAWFLHSPLLFGTTFAYIIAFIKTHFN